VECSDSHQSKNDPNRDAPFKRSDLEPAGELPGQAPTVRPNASVLKPFEQIVGELILRRRNKVFQVVTHVQ
jgi:hypothetical protein